MSRRRRDRQRRGPEQAFAVLLRALSKEGLAGEAARLEVLAAWPRAVGARIAARTQAKTFAHGVLVVQAASTTWQNELTFLRSAIIAKVNAQIGKQAVNKLRVTSGTLTPEDPTDAERRAELAPTPDDVRQASVCGAAIADVGVRAAFIKLMAVDLRHRTVGKSMRQDPR